MHEKLCCLRAATACLPGDKVFIAYSAFDPGPCTVQDIAKEKLMAMIVQVVEFGFQERCWPYNEIKVL